MRIALVSEFYYPHLGGMTEHVHNLAARLREWGHEAVIVTSRVAGDEEERPGVRYLGRSRRIYLNGSFARLTVGARLSARFAQLLRGEGIDIVHVHGGLAGTLPILAPRVADRLGIPSVATFHSWFPKSLAYNVFKRPLQRDLQLLSARIAVSEPVVWALSRYFKAEWEIIPNGVDIDAFQPRPRRLSVSNHPRLLFLGRLDPRNGLDTILEAMPRILERHPAAELVVVGDGPLRPMYERKARHLGRAVRFVGQVLEERARYYSESDIYVCPTQRASFGITLLEAAACATPMLVSDIIGFRELVNGGEEAKLVPPYDPDAWADSVGDLLADPHTRARMGMAGREKAALFSWDVVAERVLGVYERVAGRKRVAA